MGAVEPLGQYEPAGQNVKTGALAGEPAPQKNPPIHAPWVALKPVTEQYEPAGHVVEADEPAGQ
jgi:hypothetical protein